jgi:hypothetical protein
MISEDGSAKQPDRMYIPNILTTTRPITIQNPVLTGLYLDKGLPWESDSTRLWVIRYGARSLGDDGNSKADKPLIGMAIPVWEIAMKTRLSFDQIRELAQKSKQSPSERRAQRLSTVMGVRSASSTLTRERVEEVLNEIEGNPPKVRVGG